MRRASRRSATQLGVERRVEAPQTSRAPIPRPGIEDFLINWIAVTSGIDRSAIDLDTTFTKLGLDSVAAIELQASVKREFQVDVSERAMFDYQNVRQMSHHIAERLAAIAAAS